MKFNLRSSWAKTCAEIAMTNKPIVRVNFIFETLTCLLYTKRKWSIDWIRSATCFGLNSGNLMITCVLFFRRLTSQLTHCEMLNCVLSIIQRKMLQKNTYIWNTSHRGDDKGKNKTLRSDKQKTHNKVSQLTTNNQTNGLHLMRDWKRRATE